MDEPREASTMCPACGEGRAARSIIVRDHEYGLDVAPRYVECDQCAWLFQAASRAGIERRFVFFGSLVVVGLSTSGGNLGPAALKTALAYGFVYLYGTASLTVFIATLRAVSEHQIGPVGGTVTGRAAGFDSLRLTTV